MTVATGPRLADALSLLAEVADELVVRSARDTHAAWSRRSHRIVRRVVGRAGVVPEAVEAGIAGAVYGGIGAGLRATSVAFDRAAAAGLGPALEEGSRGRFVTAAVNGLIGDRLLAERPPLAIPMALRRGGRDVELTASGLADAYPDATGRVVLFVHGLCENESYWRLHADRTGTTYPDALAARGWTPLLVRANTGLGLRENGAALSALLQRVVESWPVSVDRIALVGHSLGGLVIRAAGAVDVVLSSGRRDWRESVSDVVTLGTPHLGAPIAWGIGHGSRGLGVLPETAAFGRILDWRSIGVRDLVAGLAEDVPPLPGARYRLVSATLTRSARHPVGHLLGDLLVRPRSAVGVDRSGRTLFPDAELLHVRSTDHFGLLNHPRVHAAFEQWLA